LVDFRQVLKVVYAHESWASSATFEDVLALGNEFVAFELPQDRPAVISSADEECADVIPPHAVHWLLVIAQLGEFSSLLEFFFVE